MFKKILAARMLVAAVAARIRSGFYNCSRVSCRPWPTVFDKNQLIVRGFGVSEFRA